MRLRRLAVVFGVVSSAAALSVALAPAASAHPLGNFTRNTYVGVTVTDDRVLVDHVLDLAEIPTFQERRSMDTNGDGAVSDAESSSWGVTRCATAAEQIVATTPQGALTWKVTSSAVTFPEGQGGLPTTRLECGFTSPVGSATGLELAVSVEQGRVGWHEVTAIGDGVKLSSDVPATSPSQRLTAYPVGVPPIDVESASLAWTAGAGSTAAGAGDSKGAGAAAAEGTAGATGSSASGASANGSTAGGSSAESATNAVTAIAPRGLDGATRAFTNLVGAHQVTLGFGLLALAISLALGGLHALAPGHGKTLMAASLIGTEGRRRDALVLGASVTTAHTAGVVVLAVALSLSSTIAPETAYPWLGLASATLAVGVGISLFRQARRGGGLNGLHGHSHGPGGHTHGPGGHSHGPGGHSHGPSQGDDQGHDHEDSPGQGHGHSDGHSHAPAHEHLPTVGSLPSYGLAVSGVGTATVGTATLLAEPAHEHPHPHPHEHEGEHSGAHTQGHAHPHAHAHPHPHPHPLVHTHADASVDAELVAVTGATTAPVALPNRNRAPTRRIVALGLAGGLVPSPSAIVVLLAGFALGRSWFALLLVVAYGLGMAITLTTIGVIVVRAGGLTRRVAAGGVVPGPVLAVLSRLPLIAAFVVMSAGLWLGLRSILAM